MMLSQRLRSAIMDLSLLWLLLLTIDLAQAGNGQWTGNGPEGSNIDVLVVDPNDSQTLYAGTGTGVFRLTEVGGESPLCSTFLPLVKHNP